MDWGGPVALRRREMLWTQIHRNSSLGRHRAGHVMTEAGIRATHTQQKLVRDEEGFLPTAEAGSMAHRLLASRTVGNYSPVVWGPQFVFIMTVLGNDGKS